MHDVAVRDGLLFDGVGRPRRVGDLAVTDGRIVALGQVDEPARIELDAAGLVVTPGFVDTGGAHDALVSTDRDALPRNLPGVTTVLRGCWGARDQSATAARLASLAADAAQANAGPPLTGLSLNLGRLAPIPTASESNDRAVLAAALGLSASWPGDGAGDLAPLLRAEAARARARVTVQLHGGAPAVESVRQLASLARARGSPVVWRPTEPVAPPRWPALLEALAAEDAIGAPLYWYMTDWSAADHADTLVELLQSMHTLLGGFPVDPRDREGTFVRGRLAPWLRWPGRISLEHLIAHLTGLPAALYGLSERGCLAVGRVADLAVFNADTGELAHTLVHGEPIVLDGLPTGARPGRLLRH